MGLECIELRIRSAYGEWLYHPEDILLIEELLDLWVPKLGGLMRSVGVLGLCAVGICELDNVRLDIDA